MSFLSYLGFGKMVKDGVEAFEPPKAVEPVEVPRPKLPAREPQKEFYRVGSTLEGLTTLTLMGENGYSMTLTLNSESCETMIRMLRATYSNKEHANDVD